MATKKQKREAAEAKRAAFEAQVKADGLRAQQRDHEAQERRHVATQSEIDKINLRHTAILVEDLLQSMVDLGNSVGAALMWLTIDMKFREVIRDRRKLDLPWDRPQYDDEASAFDELAKVRQEVRDRRVLKFPINRPYAGIDKLAEPGAFHEALSVGGFFAAFQSEIDKMNPLKRIRIDESQADLDWPEDAAIDDDHLGQIR